MALSDTAPLELPDPQIDAQRRLVTASDGEGHTRIAVYRDSLGCTILPPHWGAQDVARLPHVHVPRPGNPEDATTTPLEAEPGSRWQYANNDTPLLPEDWTTFVADVVAALSS